MKREFEKYFPLPWSISFYGDGVHYIETETEDDSGFWIMENNDRDTRKHNDTLEGRDALEYMVRCANLMPEIAHDLKLFFARRAYNRSPVSEVDLKRLYNRIAELVGTAQIEQAELPD